MKSWLAFFIPSDEYKEKRMLYFLSEGAILLLLSLVVMVICNQFYPMNTGLALLIPIAIFLFYVMGRYILSGIEYTDIATETAYKKEIKRILNKIGGIVVIYALLYLLIVGFPANNTEWIDFIGLLLVVGVLWFFTSFISLKRSYKKNRELL
ncbi:hypothetical protein [Paucisalibacillus globulus]|uniref:hypothetical protein n=1 Tax=Paucisalibacillus globulus TaxID=351095 RepID=UPI00040947E7|nr:hypothetical protein [Paucisalibacillus globulus]